MANYPTHLIGGIVVGLFGSSTSWYLGMISPFAIPVVALSGIFGGKVAKNWKAASKKGFEGNLTVGEGSVPGGVLVLNGKGEILLHHKELSYGLNPSDEDLFNAISKL